MPVRFRRSFNILPGVKVNVSKGGVSFTVGTKGYHLNFSRHGVRQTVGLPGSGLSHTTYLGKDDDDEPKKKTRSKSDEVGPESDEPNAEERGTYAAARRRGSPAWVLLLGLLIIYVGAVVLGLVPTNFLSQSFDSLTEWIQSIGL